MTVTPRHLARSFALAALASMLACGSSTPPPADHVAPPPPVVGGKAPKAAPARSVAPPRRAEETDQPQAGGPAVEIALADEYGGPEGSAEPSGLWKGGVPLGGMYSTGSFVNVQASAPAFNTEAYAHAAESGFRRAADDPLSTFSIDVDTASYANVRRFLVEMNRLPPADAVRIEELLNTFRHDDPEPRGDEPFSVTTEVASCPWAPAHRLMRIGLRGRSIDARELPSRNLVFLIDVSGSMQSSNKLPLVKESLRLLLDGMTSRDRVGIAVYAGAAGVVLEPTPADRKDEILAAIDGLQAGGSTNGAQGIRLAYDLADGAFVKGGANRVVLCTDGDFNVGVTSHGELVRMIEEEREKGVFLTVLGYGMGNLKDSTMEALADHGNGNYAYIDALAEAKKVLVDEADAWLVTIAKDVKIQVELNPATVESYRLIGYENRVLASEDFNDDRKDAGEIGAGHAVTALYEIVPAGARHPGSSVDALRYQAQPKLTDAARAGELATVKLRYKQPDGDTSRLIARTVQDDRGSLDEASADLRFAAGVAAFGMTLRGSEHASGASFEMARELAAGALGRDEGGHRAGFLELVDRAAALSPKQAAVRTTR